VEQNGPGRNARRLGDVAQIRPFVAEALELSPGNVEDADTRRRLLRGPLSRDIFTEHV
jgi:hypothetical protein